MKASTSLTTATLAGSLVTLCVYVAKYAYKIELPSEVQAAAQTLFLVACMGVMKGWEIYALNKGIKLPKDDEDQPPTDGAKQ